MREIFAVLEICRCRNDLFFALLVDLVVQGTNAAGLSKFYLS